MRERVSADEQRAPGPAASFVAEWREHWLTGAAAFVGMGLGTSILHNIFSLFILPLEQQFGWTRSEISLAASASFISGLLGPFVGRLIDREGARRALIFSFLSVGLIWMALAAMPGVLLIYYLLYAALLIVGAPSTGLGFARVICATFVRSRGVSLAIGRGGLSVSAMVLPVAVYAIIEHHGWRGGYLTMAALVLLVALPFVYFGIERRTGRKGPPPPAAHVASAPEKAITLREMIILRKPLIIALAAALAYAPMIAIMSHAYPMLVGRGIDGGTASWLIGALGATSLVGALLTGFLLDRFWAPAVAAVLMSFGFAGSLILALMPVGSLETALLGTVLIGFTLGAEIDICAFVVARYCGIRNYSAIYGVTVLSISFASAAGVSAMGFLYDANGSYFVPLIAASCCFLLASFAYLALGKYPARQPD